MVSGSIQSRNRVKAAGGPCNAAGVGCACVCSKPSLEARSCSRFCSLSLRASLSTVRPGDSWADVSGDRVSVGGPGEGCGIGIGIRFASCCSGCWCWCSPQCVCEFVGGCGWRWKSSGGNVNDAAVVVGCAPAVLSSRGTGASSPVLPLVRSHAAEAKRAYMVETGARPDRQRRAAESHRGDKEVEVEVAVGKHSS